jgi:hypothetical protein
MRPRVLVAWLIIGPLLGTAVSFVMGEAMIPEIIFATGGGLIGGTIYSLAGDDAALTVLCVIAGAITLMLIHDLFELATP